MHIRALTKTKPVKADILESLDVISYILSLINQIQTIITAFTAK